MTPENKSLTYDSSVLVHAHPTCQPPDISSINSHQIMTGLLVILGWIIVHYLTVVRERQKDLRDLKSQLIADVLDIEKKAIHLHQSAIFAPSEAQAIITELGRLSRSLTSTQISKLEICPTLIKEFRQSITLKNFDPSKFQPQTPESKVILDITYSADNIISSLDLKFTERYLTKWYQIFRI